MLLTDDYFFFRCIINNIIYNQIIIINEVNSNDREPETEKETQKNSSNCENLSFMYDDFESGA